MTKLRQRMVEELQRRNYSAATIRGYVLAIKQFADYFGKPPDRLGATHIQRFQWYLLQERKLAPVTVEIRMSALRFFFKKMLKRRDIHFDDLPFPKTPRKLPTVLSREEVGRMIDETTNLMHRTILMVLYGTGVRRTELSLLKVTDIDSKRMVIHIRQGKGSCDRDVPLSPKLLEALREYWRWKKPKIYLFPSTPGKRGAEEPMSDKVVWWAVREAARRAGITRKIGPHTFRHSFATELLEGGTDLRTIQLLMGHARLEDTTLYLHLSRRHLEMTINPLDQLPVQNDPKHLGAEIGFFGILHTWGQTLQQHPHIHCVVPGGGLSPEHTRWISSGSNFFLPVKVLSRVFRGKFCAGLRRAFHAKQLAFFGECLPLADESHFSRFLRTLFEQDWVVYSKPPFGGPDHVLQYLARYTHRVAISNHRILSVTDSQVRFRWNDYANHNKKRTMTLTGTEFLRRFLQHVLPKGFPRIRYFG